MKRYINSDSDARRYPKLARDAQDIADKLSDFLADLTHMPNLDDYLDEYDMADLQHAFDCLNTFADDYSNPYFGSEGNN